MSAVCPQGHTSQSEDYCDICGAPIESATSTPPAVPSPADPAEGAGEPRVCPHCNAPAAPQALFCENCGYDFTTGTAPAPVAAPAEPAEGAEPGEGAEPDEGVEPGEGAEPGENEESGEPGRDEAAEPADPATDSDNEASAEESFAEEELAAESLEGPREEAAAESEATPAEATPAEATPAESTPAEIPAVEDAAAEAAAAEAAAGQVGAGEGESSSSVITGAPATPAPERVWVVELWVDPDWYAVQRPEDAMPSPAAPAVVPLRRASVLIGRPSRSRGITPDVDCGADAGVSRRHAQLTTDGLRWWVEDLGSANGTYVSPVGGAIPDRPVPVGERTELEEGSRIYLGGWTRIVVREALPGEA